MSKTITGATKTGIILTDPADNPVSIAANATVIASIGYAISGSAQTFWTISNSGTLSGGSAGVFLHAGGHVINDGKISGGTGFNDYVPNPGGIGVLLDSGTLDNTGVIAGGAGGNGLEQPGAGGDGVRLSGGSLTSSGTITGGNPGERSAPSVYSRQGGAGIDATNSTLVLSGAVSGGILGVGVKLDGSTAQTSATITGGNGWFGQIGYYQTDGPLSDVNAKNGIDMQFSTLTNTGLIIGGSGGFGRSVFSDSPDHMTLGKAGIGLNMIGGSALNAGTITGGSSPSGVFVSGYDGGNGVSISDGMLINSGVITGGPGTQASEYNSGAYGGAGVYINGGTLQTSGTITGWCKEPAPYWSQFSGVTSAAVQFGTVASTLIVAPGAVFSGAVVANPAAADLLELSGTAPGTLGGIGSAFTGFASIVVDEGATWTLTGTNSISSSTVFTVAGTLSIAGGLSGSLTLGPNSPLLVLPGTGSLGVTLANLQPGDTIDLPSLSSNRVPHSAAPHASIEGGALVVSGADGQTATIPLSNPASSLMFHVVPDGTGGTLVHVACFVTGTRIATPLGDMPVERIQPGDPVVLANGEVRPVKWVGYRDIDCDRHPRPHDVWPVRVQASAFGTERPRQDLWLSPDHAVFFNGGLIPIRYLLNGRTIAQIPCPRVTYFHIELEHHAVLLANGLPCESYLDTGNRAAFANADGATQMHPDFAAGVWDSRACAPLVRSGPHLAVAQRMLLDVAQGHRPLLVRAPNLRVVSKAGRPIPACGGHWRFRLPRHTGVVRLVSRVWTPAHTEPGNNDARTLGVAIRRLSLDGQEIGLDSPLIGSGWHVSESGWRWTAGNAALAVEGARELAFEIAMAGHYWSDEPDLAAMPSLTPRAQALRAA